MSGSLNKVTLIGNLGKDPEIRSFQNGGRAAHFSIATTDSWKDKDSGEKKERTEWHQVAIMTEGLIKIAEKYLKKGSKVYIEGKLETRKWTDKDNHERYTTEVVLRPYSSDLIMLDGRKDDVDQATLAPEPEQREPAAA
jgi:single-strand DNA-binding protein